MPLLSYFVREGVAGVEVLEVKFRDEMVGLAQATVVYWSQAPGIIAVGDSL